MHKYQVVCGYRQDMRRSPTNSEKRFKPILEKILMGFPRSEITDRPLKFPDQKPFIFQQIFRLNKTCYIIADFFIPHLKLIFEIDGQTHNEVSQQKYDVWKDKQLANRKLTVVRIKNEETLDADTLTTKLNGIIGKRHNQLKARKSQTKAEKPLSDTDTPIKVNKIPTPKWQKDILKGKGKDYPNYKSPWEQKKKKRSKKKKEVT